MITLFGILVLGFGAKLAWDYLPRPEKLDVQRIRSALDQAQRREASLTEKLKSDEQELEHTHRLVVSTDVPLRRDSLTYEFGRRHLDTTNVDSVKAQLRRADSVVVDQRGKIAALEKDTAAKAIKIFDQASLLKTKDEKYAALDRLNASIKAQIPTTAGRVTHDAKVVGFTLSAIGLVGAIAAFAR